MPKLGEIIKAIEEFAPLHYQESYDNSGLLVGDIDHDISQALITLDCTEAVLDEAIQKKCQLVIAHHPILFSGLKSITGKNYVEKVMLKAIRNQIAIYAAHTNLDNVFHGVNLKIAEKLQLVDCSILEPKAKAIKQLYVYVPSAAADQVRKALFLSGAGSIGQYCQCSYNIEGIGTYLPSNQANPYIGERNRYQEEKEVKIEVIYPTEKESQILQALRKSHPYEEIAYGMIPLDNANAYLGSGMIGQLSKELSENAFLEHLKQHLNTQCIRHTAFLNKPIRKVAVCGGSGSFLLKKSIMAGADAFVSADFKYHQFFDAEGQILIADVGHFESEQFTCEIFYEVLSKLFPNFALHLTSVNTNPIKYFN